MSLISIKNLTISFQQNQNVVNNVNILIVVLQWKIFLLTINFDRLSLSGTEY